MVQVRWRRDNPSKGSSGESSAGAWRALDFSEAHGAPLGALDFLGGYASRLPAGTKGLPDLGRTLSLCGDQRKIPRSQVSREHPKCTLSSAYDISQNDWILAP